jgi:hypothetical protein
LLGNNNNLTVQLMTSDQQRIRLQQIEPDLTEISPPYPRGIDLSATSYSTRFWTGSDSNFRPEIQSGTPLDPNISAIVDIKRFIRHPRPRRRSQLLLFPTAHRHSVRGSAREERCPTTRECTYLDSSTCRDRGPRNRPWYVQDGCRPDVSEDERNAIGISPIQDERTSKLKTFRSSFFRAV